MTILITVITRSADPIRAIVMRHSCLVLVPDGADSLLSLLINGFRECVQDKDSDTPFEFLYVPGSQGDWRCG